MKNQYYKLDELAVLKLSKALKNPSFDNVYGTLFDLKGKLGKQPIPMTAEQLKELEKLNIIHKTTKEEWEQEQKNNIWSD